MPGHFTSFRKPSAANRLFWCFWNDKIKLYREQQKKIGIFRRKNTMCNKNLKILSSMVLATGALLGLAGLGEVETVNAAAFGNPKEVLDHMPITSNVTVIKTGEDELRIEFGLLYTIWAERNNCVIRFGKFRSEKKMNKKKWILFHKVD